MNLKFRTLLIVFTLLIFVTSCSSIDGGHLVGLWKSNKELTMQNNTNSIKFAEEELGKIYHYYTEDRLTIIYLDKKNEELLNDILNGQYVGNKSGSEFVYGFDYKIISKDESATVIRKQVSFGIEEEHVLHFEDAGGCYFIDPSDNDQYMKEYFCRVM